MASPPLIFKKPSEFHYKCLLLSYWKWISFKTSNSYCNFLNVFDRYLPFFWFLSIFYLVHIGPFWLIFVLSLVDIGTICDAIITVVLCLAPLDIMPRTLPQCQTIFIHPRWKDNSWIKYIFGKHQFTKNIHNIYCHNI